MLSRLFISLPQLEDETMKVGIACGGTGGHIFPGLAVAMALRERHHEVVLWLAGRDVESVSTAKWDGPVVSIGGKGLPAGVSLRSLPALCSLGAAFLRSWLRMRKDPPHIMLAMGGYGSVGPVLAARVLKIPVVLHEANAIPGRAVEKLSRYAAAVAVSFESAKRYITHHRIVLTGFPVRTEVCSGNQDRILPAGLFTVLVVGGSQGAHRLNELASAALCRLHQQGIPVQVIHLSGTVDETVVRKTYGSAGIPNAVFSFFGEMARAYSQADIVIARAGAATCAEIVKCAVPSILIPLPTAMRDHQMANAMCLKNTGGVEVMAEREISASGLSDFLRECYRNPEKLDRMRESLKKIPQDNAAGQIAELLEITFRSVPA